MDNEKDLYIMKKLQKDQLISKKADDVFNNFFKENLIMEEKTDVKINNSTKKI